MITIIENKKTCKMLNKNKKINVKYLKSNNCRWLIMMKNVFHYFTIFKGLIVRNVKTKFELERRNLIRNTGFRKN